MSAAESYAHLLDECFKGAKEWDCVAPENKLEFVGNHIFDFTTYDSELDAKFAKRMLEVIEAISNRTTFEYHGQGQEKYENYIIMCNMPFLADKIEWGTSIRGAWFDAAPFSIDLNIPSEITEVDEFMKALIKWVNE